MPRLFAALVPPPAVQTILLDSMTGVAGARWQNAAQLHLTLAFFGDVDAAHGERLVATLAAIRHPPITVGIDGIGQFDSRGRPQSLWARIEPDEALSRLSDKTLRAARRAGLHPESRAFIPHITLARLGSGSGAIDAFVTANAALTCAPFVVEQFFLIESLLGENGSTYLPLQSFPLSG